MFEKSWQELKQKGNTKVPMFYWGKK